MADPAQAPVAGEGATATAPEGTTQAAPATDQGQAPATTSQSTGQASTGQAPEDTFFDPTQVPAELQPAYKLMQSAFTKKMTGLSERDREIQSLRQFAPVIEQYQRDPVTTIQQLAAQHGMSITRAQAAGIAAQQAEPQSQQWEPQTWDEVIARSKQETRDEILRELAPVIGNVQQMQARNVEAQLDGIDPEWRTYEKEMMSNLKEHPTLVKNVEKLYRLSVPMEVIETRATQTALSKLTKKTDAAKASGTSTVRSSAAPPEIKSFDDAVAYAKAQINSRR